MCSLFYSPPAAGRRGGPERASIRLGRKPFRAGNRRNFAAAARRGLFVQLTPGLRGFGSHAELAVTDA